MRRMLNYIEGADTYLVVSLCIFLGFFILVGLYLVFMRKDHVKKMSEMPLNDEPENQTDSESIDDEK